MRKLPSKVDLRVILVRDQGDLTSGVAMAVTSAVEMNMREQVLNHPFDQVVKEAVRQIELGHDVYQKFTCSGCGQRLTIEEPNRFYQTGTCDQCPATTDIVKHGCNFMVHMRLK